MFPRNVFIVFCATLAVSTMCDEYFVMVKENDGEVDTLLKSMTVLMTEYARLPTNDLNKYALDMNIRYEKYDLEDKEQLAKIYLKNQLRRGMDSIKKYIESTNSVEEDKLLTRVQAYREEDPVYAERLQKIYEKLREFQSSDYMFIAKSLDEIQDKILSELRPVEQKLIKTLTKFEIAANEVIKEVKVKS